MTTLTIILGIFLALESANVAALYFWTGSEKFNALGVFRAWEASRAHPELHALIRYLAWWVAGTKLIFIALLGVILALGSPTLKVAAVAALVLSILTFFWRLHPLIRQMDARGQLTRPGYARTLGWMIAAFLIALLVALLAGGRAIAT